MSLDPQPLPPVPAETARVAQAAFPQGHRYLTLREALGALYRDEDFAGLFARRGQPAESPAQLALVTVLQFAEGLTDREAAEAVRGRIDWKYLLGLELTDPGFDYSLLSEFRARLLTTDAAGRLLDQLLEWARTQGLFKPRGAQRTDSTHVLAAVRDLNRLELVGETLRAALNALAEAAPDWLRGWVPAEWYTRYGRRIEQFRLPKSDSERQAWVLQVGADGAQLLAAAYAPDSAAGVRGQWAVEVVRQVWVQQFYWADNQLHWRQSGNLPPAARMIQSPYDVEARYSYKRETEWVGYKTHLTETCDDDQPHLITQVTTTLATTPDAGVLPAIQADLAARGRLPSEHLVDAGYTTASNLVISQERHEVDLVGPAAADTTWQARQSPGFAQAHFAIDWEQQQVRCPSGHTSAVWAASQNEWGHAVIHVQFAKARCQACPVRTQCTPARGPRTLKLRPQAEHVALQAARQRQTQPEFRRRYARRAGVESTQSQAVRVCDLRHSRYWGLAKTHLQHVLSAIGLNFLRLADWLRQPGPARRASTAFAALAPVLAA